MYYDERPDRGKSAKPSVALYDSHVFLFLYNIMLATLSDLILRVVLSFVFASFLGVTGVWLSWPFGWSVGSVLSLWCNCNVTKRLEKTFA